MPSLCKSWYTNVWYTITTIKINRCQSMPSLCKSWYINVWYTITTIKINRFQLMTPLCKSWYTNIWYSITVTQINRCQMRTAPPSDKCIHACISCDFWICFLECYGSLMWPNHYYANCHSCHLCTRLMQKNHICQQMSDLWFYQVQVEFLLFEFEYL